MQIIDLPDEFVRFLREVELPSAFSKLTALTIQDGVRLPAHLATTQTAGSDAEDDDWSELDSKAGSKPDAALALDKSSVLAGLNQEASSDEDEEEGNDPWKNVLKRCCTPIASFLLICRNRSFLSC